MTTLKFTKTEFKTKIIKDVPQAPKSLDDTEYGNLTKYFETVKSNSNFKGTASAVAATAAPAAVKLLNTAIDAIVAIGAATTAAVDGTTTPPGELSADPATKTVAADAGKALTDAATKATTDAAAANLDEKTIKGILAILIDVYGKEINKLYIVLT